MVWSELRKYTEFIKSYSTATGRIWFAIFGLFRLLIVTTVGSQVYGDEQGQFKCDTTQPGCQNVCYNRFSPISHLRFWSFQMLFVCVPKFILYSYINHSKAEEKLIQDLTNKLRDDENEAQK